MTELPMGTTTGSPSSLLMGLAILKVNAESNRGTYLDSFFPFVAQGIIDCTDPRPSWINISTAVNKRFQLRLPAGVVQHIVLRMASRKKLKRYPDGTIELSESLEASSRLKNQTKRFLREHNSFLDAFRKYCATSDVAVDHETAEQELLAFVEEHGINILSEEMEAVEPTERAQHEANDDPRINYLLPRFIRDALDEGTPYGDHVLNLIKGMWIASSIYDADEAGEISRPFVNTTIYFDTRVVLRALGFAGSELQEATGPTLSLCSSAGARIAVFEHTVDEIRGVLIATAKASLDHRQVEPTQEVDRWLLEAEGVSADDILRASDDLENTLRFHKLEIDERPPHVAALTVDEISLI